LLVESKLNLIKKRNYLNFSLHYFSSHECNCLFRIRFTSSRTPHP
jgi:hypothetical protein